jgi:hypothetical protein
MRHNSSLRRKKTEKMAQKIKTSVEENLSSFEHKALCSMKAALTEIKNLAMARHRAKLSASRARGVAGELSELIKLLSEYGC